MSDIISFMGKIVQFADMKHPALMSKGLSPTLKVKMSDICTFYLQEGLLLPL